jgi:2-methylcitrate dehydratase PrpD
MTLDHTTEKLVGLASNLQFDDVPAGALIAAKARILSTLGVSLAAFDLEPVRLARKLVQPTSGP